MKTILFSAALIAAITCKAQMFYPAKQSTLNSAYGLSIIGGTILYKDAKPSFNGTWMFVAVGVAMNIDAGINLLDIRKRRKLNHKNRI